MISFKMKIILCSLLLFYVSCTTGERGVCSSNENLDSCPNPCQPTCGRPTPPTCQFLRCEAACVCKPNLIRRSETGDCVPPYQCPRVPRCNSTNEVFNECASPCIQTCQSRCSNLEICPASICVRRCECRPGYIRDERTNQCVPERYCPRCNNCPQNEVFTQCGSACIETCQNPLSNFCTQQCKPGCICERGLIRDEVSGRCVPRQRCPRRQPNWRD